MKRCLPWESSNELAWLQRAELDPEVTAFYAQALAVELIVDGRRRSYIPDGVVVRCGRVEVHEVKPDADAKTEEVLALASAAERHIRLRGAIYGFALESVLKARPVYDNMPDILRRLHRRVPEALARRLIAQVQDAGPLAIAALVEAVRKHGAVTEDVLALAARGQLRIDLQRPVSKETLIWASEAFLDTVPILPTPTLPARTA